MSTAQFKDLLKEKIGLLHSWKSLFVKLGATRSSPWSHSPIKNEQLGDIIQLCPDSKTQLSETIQTHKCCAVPKTPLCRGTTSNCTWGLGSTVAQWSPILRLSLTLSQDLSYFLMVEIHSTEIEQSSHLVPADTPNFLLSSFWHSKSLPSVSSFGSI